jgi:hypothetical protein
MKMRVLFGVLRWFVPLTCGSEARKHHVTGTNMKGARNCFFYTFRLSRLRLRMFGHSTKLSCPHLEAMLLQFTLQLNGGAAVDRRGDAEAVSGGAAAVASGDAAGAGNDNVAAEASDDAAASVAAARGGGDLQILLTAGFLVLADSSRLEADESAMRLVRRSPPRSGAAWKETSMGVACSEDDHHPRHEGSSMHWDSSGVDWHPVSQSTLPR